MGVVNVCDLALYQGSLANDILREFYIGYIQVVETR